MWFPGDEFIIQQSGSEKKRGKDEQKVSAGIGERDPGDLLGDFDRLRLCDGRL